MTLIAIQILQDRWQLALSASPNGASPLHYNRFALQEGTQNSIEAGVVGALHPDRFEHVGSQQPPKTVMLDEEYCRRQYQIRPKRIFCMRQHTSRV